MSILFGEVACKKVNNLQPELPSLFQNSWRLYRNKTLESNNSSKIDYTLPDKMANPVKITSNIFVIWKATRELKEWKIKENLFWNNLKNSADASSYLLLWVPESVCWELRHFNEFQDFPIAVFKTEINIWERQVVIFLNNGIWYEFI